MHKFIDITGERFGKLIAKSFVGVVNGDNRTKWQCICDCGVELLVRSNNLRTGISKSCGCARKENTILANTKHGKSQNTREYYIWTNLRGRCNNKNSEDYPKYGGRGIKVCERWDNFSNFMEDMGKAPVGYSIDRIDVNGNYEPSNCRWADAKTQARNKTNNRLISANGIIKTMAEWAEIAGIDRRRIHSRIARGWTSEQAIFGKQICQ